MLRKTLAATPQAKRGPCWEPPEGGSQNRGPPHTRAPTRAGWGPTSISGGGQSSVGQSRGLPWGKRELQNPEPRALVGLGQAGLPPPAEPTVGGLSTGAPQGGLEGDKGKGFRRCRRQAEGHSRARTHDQTQGHSQNWRAITSSNERD